MALGLGEALLGVVGHFGDPADLGGINAQESAPAAGMFVNACCAVRPVAVTECDASKKEVLFEFGPFVGVGWPVLGTGAQLSASFDEVLVRCDEVLGKYGGVAASGLEIEVTK